jgi:hypothetical protein
MKKNEIALGFTVLIIIIVAGLVYHEFNKPPSPPPAPLKWSFRPSKITGLVLQLQNTSDEHLSCKMWAVNKVQEETTRYSFNLSPYENTEIGVLECNWAFQTGETVDIKTEGFADSTFTVP